MALFVCLFFLIISTASACNRCVHQTKIAHYSSDAALEHGACGYRALALSFSKGYLAAAPPHIYNNGTACGACFQMRCKNPAVCNPKGVRVTVIDLNSNNETGFVLSQSAFKALSIEGKGEDILKTGVMEVDYRRVACLQDQNQKLAVRVEESSEYPHYLVLKPLYQAGQTDIVGIDVSAAGTSNWINMVHNYGAVWEANHVPRETPLQLQFVVNSGHGKSWRFAANVIPAEWKKGEIYRTDIQIEDIAQEICEPCDESLWGGTDPYKG